MNAVTEHRTNMRRFDDRRMVLMLAIYKILFHEHNPAERLRQVLQAVMSNYGADGGLFLRRADDSQNRLKVMTARNLSPDLGFEDSMLGGEGIETLVQLQTLSPGILSLTRVKRPSTFSRQIWDDLWDGALKGASMSLFCVSIEPQKAPAYFLWLLQDSYSREWNSRDRELAEEAAAVLAEASDRSLNGGESA